MKKLLAFSCIGSIFLSACGNPGGISNEDYAKYKELGAPKILYACDKGIPTSASVMANISCLERKDTSSNCVESEMKKVKPVIDVGYAAGVGVAVTYNKLLSDTKSGCEGEFKILESKS